MLFISEKCKLLFFFSPGEAPLSNPRTTSTQTLTNTEDVEAEATVHRLVDQLVRHTVKANMARQRHRTDSFTLKAKIINHNASITYSYTLKNLSKAIWTYS